MKRLIENPIVWICISFLYITCSEEPIPYDLEMGDINSLHIRADSLNYFRTYQSSPEMRGLTNLYYGKTDEFPEIYSLVNLTSSFLDTVYNQDSTAYDYVTSIDSAIFSLILVNASDALFQPTLFYFSVDIPIFNENESSFYTVEDTLSTIALPSPSIVTDTSFSFDVTSLFNENILNVSQSDSFVFKIGNNGVNDAIVAFKDPIIEVHYSIGHYIMSDGAVDSTWSDTIFIHKESELTIVDPGSWTESDENTFSIGRAKGLKTIAKFNLDTLLTLPNNIIFVNADLYLKHDLDSSTYNGFKIIGNPLKDSIDFNFNYFGIADSIQVEPFFGVTSASINASDSISFNIRNYLNYIYLDEMENYGLQLSSSLNNNPFNFATFNKDSIYMVIKYVSFD